MSGEIHLNNLIENIFIEKNVDEFNTYFPHSTNCSLKQNISGKRCN